MSTNVLQMVHTHFSSGGGGDVGFCQVAFQTEFEPWPCKAPA